MAHALRIPRLAGSLLLILSSVVAVSDGRAQAPAASASSTASAASASASHAGKPSATNAKAQPKPEATRDAEKSDQAQEPKDSRNGTDSASTADCPVKPPPSASQPLTLPSLKIIDIQILDAHASDKAHASSQQLTGAGDILLELPNDAYCDERYYTAWSMTPLRLYINGINMGDDARLLAIQQSDKGTALYRFYVQPGKDSADVWAFLYRAGGLMSAQPVKIGLGWSTQQAGVAVIASNKPVSMSISSKGRVSVAVVLVLALLALFWRVAVKTDALRDAPLPAEQRVAMRQGTAPKVTRGTYSLAKSQLALWFLFAMGAGIFLYVAKGGLQPLDGSVLILLGIALGTAGAGQLSPGATPTFEPSKGFITDLITDRNDSEQFHRYQALAVNLLLLIVGIYHVVQQLTYPVFDNSWLYFLGLSGAAYAAGKGLVESKA